jgi:hypothetical protein
MLPVRGANIKKDLIILTELSQDYPSMQHFFPSALTGPEKYQDCGCGSGLDPYSMGL